MIKFSDSVIGSNGVPSHPTVFAFHGWGANKEDLVNLAEVFPRTWNWRFIQGPVSLGSNSFGWFPHDLSIFQQMDPLTYFLDLSKGFQQELGHIKNYLLGLLNILPQPQGPVVLVGFSQGAMICLACAFELQVFSTIHGIMAFSPTSWKSLETRILQGDLSEQKDLTLILSHGYHDPLLPFERTEKLGHLLSSRLEKVHFIPFSGYHEIPREVLTQANLIFSDSEVR